jgi:hypothetical protein
MLSMTPAERLETLQGFVDSVWEALGDDAETRFSSYLSALDRVNEGSR